MEPSERRQQILRAAAELFGERGYHATSISDIIQAAGIARGTFYLYFENKRAIFVELVDQLFAGIKGCIQMVEVDEGAPSAREQLIDNLVRVLDLLTANRPLLSILLEGAVGLDKEFGDKLASFYDLVTDAVESSLTLGQELGLVRPCDKRIAALGIVGGLKENLHHILRAGDLHPDFTILATEFLDFFSRGVLVPGVTIP